MSQAPLLGQCRGFLREHGIAAVVGADTAGSAEAVAAQGDPTLAALASELAGRDLRARGAGAPHRGPAEQHHPLPGDGAGAAAGAAPSDAITTFVFRVRNIPAALYKAMGGFATNGVNMTKLESYMLDGAVHRDAVLRRHRGASGRAAGGRALEELGYFTTQLQVLGSTPAVRRTRSRGADGGGDHAADPSASAVRR